MINETYAKNLMQTGQISQELKLAEKKYCEINPKYREIPDVVPYNVQMDARYSGFVFNPSLTIAADRFGQKMSDLWTGLDNKENYDRRLQQFGESWYYKDRPLVYTVNDYGYRTQNFSEIKSWKKTIPIFGCSMVYGIGNCEEDIFPTLLQQSTNRQTVNFGFPSGSNHIILRNIVALINLVDPEDFPEYIVIGWTFSDRSPYYSFDNEVALGPWQTVMNNPKLIEATEYYKSRNYQNYLGAVETYYIRETIKTLLKGRCKLIEYSFAFTHIFDCVKIEDPVKKNEDHLKARDVMHPSIFWHKKVHDYILGEIV